MKKGEIVQLWNTLHRFRGSRSTKLSYAILRNTKILKTVVQEIQMSQKLLPESSDFENARLSLCEKMAAKDESGKPKMENGYRPIAKPT